MEPLRGCLPLGPAVRNLRAHGRAWSATMKGNIPQPEPHALEEGHLFRPPFPAAFFHPCNLRRLRCGLRG
jgi:hypothetical protein